MHCWMRSGSYCEQHEDARLTLWDGSRGTMPGKESIYRKCYGQGRVCRRFRRWALPPAFPEQRAGLSGLFAASWYNKPAYHRR